MEGFKWRVGFFCQCYLKGNEPSAIGSLVYEDIKQIMDSVPCNEVEVNICYTPIEKTE